MRPASILLILEVFMDVVLGTIVLCLAGIGVLGLFILGSLHILKCTEHNHVRNASQNAQETFSWASVGETILRVFSGLCGLASDLGGHASKLADKLAGRCKKNGQ